MTGPENVVWKVGDTSPPAHSKETMRDQAKAKYRGDVAKGYDAKREDTQKHKDEQVLVTDMLADIPFGSRILDCPCGTGRFIPLYENPTPDGPPRFIATLVDLSEDMLAQARPKTATPAITFQIGDILNLGMKDDSFDVALMVRLTRWLSPEDCVRALRELQRLALKRIIFTARVRNSSHVRGYDLIASALSGWDIARDEQIGDDRDYRMICLEKG